MKYSRIALFILATLTLSATAESVKLTCTAPVTREDGKALTLNELASYTFFRGAVNVGASAASAGCALTYTPPLDTCIEATEPFFVTATDTDGRVSKLSAPGTAGVKICNPKPLTPPAAPKLTAERVGSGS